MRSLGMCVSCLVCIPQGSLLGALLFLIFIDDISGINLSEKRTLNLYVNDMLLYYTGLIKTLK